MRSRTFSAVVYGDVNADGIINILDITLIRAHIVQESTLSGASFVAADVYNQSTDYVNSVYNAVVNIVDLNLIRNMTINANFMGDISLLSITETGHSHAQGLTVPSNNDLLENVHYSVNFYADKNPTETIELMKNSTAFISRSHGTDMCICVAGGWLKSSLITPLADDAFVNNRLMLFGACNTAFEEDGDSFVDTVYSKGAKTVMGFTTSVNCGTATAWTEQFIKNLGNGCRIGVAKRFADDYIIDNNYLNAVNFTDCIIRGSTLQMITQPYTIRFDSSRRIFPTYADFIANNLYLTSNVENGIQINASYGNSNNIITQKVLSESEILNIANTELSKTIDISKYNLFEFKYNDASECYYIIYNKIINGIPTDDIAYIFINPKGEIFCEKFKNTNAFDEIDLSTFDLTSLQNEVVNAYDECVEIDYNYIALDDNENYIMRVGISSENYIDCIDVPIN